MLTQSTVKLTAFSVSFTSTPAFQAFTRVEHGINVYRNTHKFHELVAKIPILFNHRLVNKVRTLFKSVSVCSRTCAMKLQFDDCNTWSILRRIVTSKRITLNLIIGCSWIVLLLYSRVSNFWRTGGNAVVLIMLNAWCSFEIWILSSCFSITYEDTKNKLHGNWNWELRRQNREMLYLNYEIHKTDPVLRNTRLEMLF